MKEMNASSQEQGENRLNNDPWVRAIEGDVKIYDDIQRSMSSFPTELQEYLLHICLQLEENLERDGVTVHLINPIFDNKLHRPEHPTTRIPDGTPIEKTVSAGFSYGTRVFRKAVVRLSSISQ